MQTITKPTLLIDETKCRRNIRMMADKAKKHNVRLRPHFKTHQSLAVGEWYREAGIDCLTTSSLKMAKYFAQNGWQDITIAFPFYAQEISGINKLAEEIDINVIIVSPESIKSASGETGLCYRRIYQNRCGLPPYRSTS